MSQPSRGTMAVACLACAVRSAGGGGLQDFLGWNGATVNEGSPRGRRGGGLRRGAERNGKAGPGLLPGPEEWECIWDVEPCESEQPQEQRLEES